MSSIISNYILWISTPILGVSAHRCFEEVQYTCFLPFHAAHHYWHFSFHTYVRMCCSNNERDSKFNLNSDHEEKKTYFHMSSKVLVTTAIKLTMHNFHYYPAEIYVYIRVYRWVYALIGALSNKYYSCTIISACLNIDIQCLTTILNKVKLAFHPCFLTFLRRTLSINVFCKSTYVWIFYMV